MAIDILKCLQAFLITGDGTEMNPYQAVIIDFGISIMANELDAQGHATGIVGSPAFYAPDMLNRRPYAPDKADLWSFGCVLLELVVGHIIFKDGTWRRAPSSSLLSSPSSRPLLPSNPSS